jgi:hypothetical protein
MQTKASTPRPADGGHGEAFEGGALREGGGEQGPVGEGGRVQGSGFREGTEEGSGHR